MPTLSEADSRRLVEAHGVVVSPWRTAPDAAGAQVAAAALGWPVVVKLCGPTIAHKSERGLVHVGLGGPDDVAAACDLLLAAVRPDDGPVELLVTTMVRGRRELLAGMHRDERFGATVLVGVGGVLAEAVADVSVRLAPLGPADAGEMIDDLRAGALLGAFRGEPAVDRGRLAVVLDALGRLAVARPDVVAVDLNPLVVHGGVPVAVDALVEVA